MPLNFYLAATSRLCHRRKQHTPDRRRNKRRRAFVIETLIIGGLVLSAAAGGYSAYQNHSAKKQQAFAQTRQSIAEKNQARFNQQRADEALAAGKLEQRRRLKLLAQESGSARAAFAGNGILVDDGSADHFLDSLTMEAGEDVSIIGMNARQQANAFLNNASVNELNSSLLLSSANHLSNSAGGELGASLVGTLGSTLTAVAPLFYKPGGESTTGGTTGSMLPGSGPYAPAGSGGGGGGGGHMVPFLT